MVLTQLPCIFFFRSVTLKPVIFQSQQQIGYFKWFFAQSSFLKFEIQH